MVKIDAVTALRASGAVFLFFSVAMAFFPDKLLAPYGFDDFFGCPKRSPGCDSAKQEGFTFQMMFFFATQMMAFSFTCVAFTRDGASPKAQSVLLLCNTVVYAYWIVKTVAIDLRKPNWPASIPLDGQYFNVVLWAVLGALSYLGWKDSGSVIPDKAALMPQGRFGMPLLAGIANNLLSYGLPLVFARAAIMEQFAVDAFTSGFTADVNFLIDNFMENVGTMMITNALTNIAICSVAPTNEDSQVRLLRIWTLCGFMTMGFFSANNIIEVAFRHTNPMKTFQIIKDVGVIAYMTRAWITPAFTIKK